MESRFPNVIIVYTLNTLISSSVTSHKRWIFRWKIFIHGKRRWRSEEKGRIFHGNKQLKKILKPRVRLVFCFRIQDTSKGIGMGRAWRAAKIQLKVNMPIIKSSRRSFSAILFFLENQLPPFKKRSWTAMVTKKRNIMDM